jgi:RNA polymerase-binding transcription factor DksA
MTPRTNRGARARSLAQRAPVPPPAGRRGSAPPRCPIRDQRADAPHTLEADEDPTELDVSLIEIANDTLRVSDAAIERLDRGEYGRCTRCHRPNAMARLRALPLGLRCRECEMIRERESALERSNSRPKPRIWTGSCAPPMRDLSPRTLHANRRRFPFRS